MQTRTQQTETLTLPTHYFQSTQQSANTLKHWKVSNYARCFLDGDRQCLIGSRCTWIDDYQRHNNALSMAAAPPAQAIRSYKIGLRFGWLSWLCY